MRTPIIAGNWKMNTTIAEAKKLVEEMRSELDRVKSVEKVLCPPFVSLAAIRELTEASSVKLGAQNMYFEPKGAYTGEISPAMIAELCEFVILGHSERRQYFHENGDIINRKVRAALEIGLKPILCVGEKLEENDGRKTEEVVGGQLRSALANIGPSGGLVIAYEPVWAIGTGRAATGAQANKTIGFIRSVISELLGKPISEAICILYGGSVTAVNTAEFMEQPEIDGALVGGASLKADEFLKIVSQTARIKQLT